MVGPPGAEVDGRALPNGGWLIEVRAELDVAAAPALRAAIRRALDQEPTGLLVDLSAVEFVDSVCAAVLVGVHRHLEGRVAVLAVHPYVLLVFEAGGIDGILNVFDDRDDAMAFVGG